MTPLDDISASVEQVRNWLNGRTPQLAIVLGSGLASIVDELQDPQSLSYAELPDFCASGVVGHAGCLHSGLLFNCPVLLFQGRYHYYEGYSAWQVTAPVRMAAALDCKRLLLTNAAGGVVPEMSPGDYMLVTDHLNLSGVNPLRGRPELDFTDLGGLYRHDFYPTLQASLVTQGVNLHAGVLAWMPGPSYETPAEIKMLELLGAAAVSMSTVPEAIVAHHFGLEVIAVSYLSNLAAGKTSERLDHQSVLNVGLRGRDSLKTLCACLMPYLFS